MKRSNRASKHSSGLIILTLAILIFVLVGCHSECGDLFNRSPSDLYAQNDLVALAKWTRTDTLLRLGTFENFGSQEQFVLVEYEFVADRTFKRTNQRSNVYLWNCEYIRIRDGYSTIAKIDPSETRLVYGRTLTDHDSVGNVLSTQMAAIETVDLESRLKAILMASDTLQTILSARVKAGTVIYGTDESLATFDDFASGKLCYYDSKGAAHQVTAEEYGEELARIAQAVPQ